MATDNSDMPGPSSAQPPPIPQAGGVSSEGPQTQARETYEMAMAHFRQALQFPAMPLEGIGIDLLAEAMALDPKFLDAALMLGMKLCDVDSVKYRRKIVECATRAYLIDKNHPYARMFLADVLDVDECRPHFLLSLLAQGSCEVRSDEIDDFIDDLRAKAKLTLRDDYEKYHQ